MGVSNQRQYITKEQIESLYWVGGLPLRETARKLGTNTDSLCKRMKEVGLKTRNLSESHIGHIPYNKGINFQSNTGKTHFKKNHIPWNKGLTKKDDPRIKSNPGPHGKIPWNKGLNKENCDIYKKLSEERSGENHWMWKGGVTSKRKSIFCSNEYQKFRKTILKKFNYTCLSCGEKKKLHVHHIERFADMPQKVMDENNCIVLCKKCHQSLGAEHSTPLNIKEKL